MAKRTNTTKKSEAAVISIYIPMLGRADDLARNEEFTAAAAQMDQAAEVMRRFNHPEAEIVAGWAMDLRSQAEVAISK